MAGANISLSLMILSGNRESVDGHFIENGQPIANSYWYGLIVCLPVFFVLLKRFTTKCSCCILFVKVMVYYAH